MTDIVLGVLVGAFAGLVGFVYLKRCRRHQGGWNSIAFFHPFTNAGGGGERVLWSAVVACAKTLPNKSKIYIYTGDWCLSDAELLRNAQIKFNLDIPSAKVRFVRIYSRALLEASTYDRFLGFGTLLGQAIGSLIVGMECMIRHPAPPLIVDTMGAAFCYPVWWMFGSRIDAYVHYPFIRAETYSKGLKSLYYSFLAWAYGLCGALCHSVMANSTWTRDHLVKVWRRQERRIALVYPPCNVSKSIKWSATRSPWIVSLGQFRPEKNHELQLKAFALFLSRHETTLRLILIGGCRGWEDLERVERLKALSRKLGIADRVQWEVDVGHDRKEALLAAGLIGLHTMVEEHFGIGIVEGMAAGLLTVAHASGGPQADIITDGSLGWLATTPEQYAACFEEILNMDPQAQEAVRQAARRHVQERFGMEQFSRAFCSNIHPISK